MDSGTHDQDKGIKNSFLPAKDVIWDMESKVILVACLWRASWLSCRHPDVQLEAAQMVVYMPSMRRPSAVLWRCSVLFIMTAVEVFHCILPHPTTPVLGILQPTGLANDHKFLITTFRSLAQKAVSTVLPWWESGRP